MKATIFKQAGGPEVLVYEEVSDPSTGAKEALVEVEACGVNRIDVWYRSGVYKPARLPHILGVDVAGVVRAAGQDVTHVGPGDRVLVYPVVADGTCEFCLANKPNQCYNLALIGAPLPGGYAELVNVPGENLIPLPASLDFDSAACVPVNFATAWSALVSKARVKPGETVLIAGAGGGVGYAAVQIARMFGARVIATVGSEEKAEKARKLGAEAILNHNTEDVEARVKAITEGAGAEIVLDHIGADFWNKALKMLKRGGRLVNCGATTGTDGRIDIRYFYRNEFQLHGVYAYTKAELVEVLRHIIAGRLKPVIDRALPLSKASEAHRVMEGRQHFGKILLKP